MNKSATDTYNRCHRCNRKLSDPTAQYGWRCAEISGVAQILNYSGDGSFSSYMLGIKAINDFIRENNIDAGKIDLLKLYQAYTKQCLAAGINNHELFDLAYDDMIDALRLRYDKKGNPVYTKSKSPPLSNYLIWRDYADAIGGKYTTTAFTDNQFKSYVCDLQKALNSVGYTDKFGFSLKEDGIWGPKTQWVSDELNKQVKNAKMKLVAKEELNKILDSQYSGFKTVDIQDVIRETGVANEVTANYALGQNIIGKIADWRMNNAFEKIDASKSAIIAVENELEIPREVIGSVILKEIYTSKLPDWTAEITTTIGKRAPFLENNWGKLFGEHSTGAGSIFPSTARTAWENYLGGESVNGFLPESDLELQNKLSVDGAFNIRTIGIVLADKASQLGLISDISDLKHLSYSEWEKVLAKYNGSTIYGKKTLEYLPHMKIYLE